MNICDLHCDTPLELMEKNARFASNNLQIAADKCENIDTYVQLGAFCAPVHMSDHDGYDYFFKCADNFLSEVGKCGFAVCENSAELQKSIKNHKGTFILTIEDARILSGAISRLDDLYNAGVRLITPLWGGVTCIGGAHDSEDEGLSDFGFKVVERCVKKGILVDISHASKKSAYQIYEILRSHDRPVIATHSNSYSVCPHTRNLTDEQLEYISRTGGIVGISLYPPHLTKSPHCSSDDVCRHVEHYVDAIGEDAVCLGCDFDGIDSTPANLGDVSKMNVLYEALISHGFTVKQTEKIFFKNAYNFLAKYL